MLHHRVDTFVRSADERRTDFSVIGKAITKLERPDGGAWCRKRFVNDQYLFHASVLLPTGLNHIADTVHIAKIHFCMQWQDEITFFDRVHGW